MVIGVQWDERFTKIEDVFARVFYKVITYTYNSINL
jgi:hypothetical protein